MIGLTYSIEAAVTPVPESGSVLLTKMDHFYGGSDPNATASDRQAQAAIAHDFGAVSSSNVAWYQVDLEPSPSFSFMDPSHLLAYELGDRFIYHFTELNADADLRVYTARAVDATYACVNRVIVDGADGTSSNVTYRTGEGNSTDRLYVGADPSPGATIYITEIDRVCGPRCARVWGFQSIVPNSQHDNAYLYQCNITVGPVTNATRPEHELPDTVAWLAAGAIGLDGYNRSTVPITQNSRYHNAYVSERWTRLDQPSKTLIFSSQDGVVVR